MLGLPAKNPNVAFEKLKTAAEQARLPFDRDAWLNLAFYLDEQYIEWSDQAGSLRRIPRPANQQNLPRPQFNKIMHYVQQAHAEVLQDKPSADVLPANDDYFAPADAAVAKSYCEYVTEPVNANWDRQLSRAALWALIAGNGWMKWVWNTALKRPDIVAPNYFEVFPDPYAKDFSKARYVIHQQFMDTEQVYEQFGVEPNAGSTQSADPTRTALLRGMGSAPVLNGVTVNELWHKPSRRYPDGLYVVWAGNQQLTQPGPLPYKHLRENGGRLPFTHIGAIERPDSMMYKSPVSYLRSSQMTFNKSWAQDIMIRERFANPKWWIPSELELEEQPNDAPFQVLRGFGNNGLKPELIHPPAITGNGEQLQRLEEQMMHIVGLHEVSQAQVPGRVEAAKAIELLKQSDEGRYKSMYDTIDASIAEGWYQVLMLAREFEPENRMVHIYSTEGLPEVKHLRKGQIDPGMRIHVTRMNGLGRTRAARQDALLNLWQQKIITDPDLIARLMEVGVPSFTQPNMEDVRQARNENLEMQDGTAVKPNSWDNHAIHLREHNSYRKTQEFLTASEETRTLFEFHCDQHDKLMLDQIVKQAKMMQAQALAAGGPPAPPGGGGPAPADGGTATDGGDAGTTQA